MSASLFLTLKDSHVEPKLTAEEISLKFSGLKFTWTSPTIAQLTCTKMLLEGKATEEALQDQWLKESSDPSEDISYFFYFLEKLKLTGALSYCLYEGRTHLATFSGKNLKIKFPRQTVKLSRFTFVRFDEGSVRMETPLSSSFMSLHDTRCFQILQALSSFQTIQSLTEKGLSFDWLELFIDFLGSGNFLDNQEKNLTMWEFHDLLFHARSREGRHANPVGAVFPFLNIIPPLPAVKPITRKSISFPPLDRNNFRNKGMTLTEVFETRQSIREQGDIPISYEELGEFLYRSARIKGRKIRENYEATERLYPGAGAAYELEIYLSVFKCSGLERGFYRYDPQNHGLECITSWNQQIELLMANAMKAAKAKDLPQILITVAARFARISWKYRSMAYATILKDTGVILQTFYLVATAMELAPSAIGRGDSDLFSLIANTDYYEESSVGEFILGSKRPS